MTIFAALHPFAIRARPAAAALAVLLAGAAALVAAPALGQSSIPPNLTQLRPIKCIAYDPKPSDFYQNAYFDSDFFNSDFTGIWGDDGHSCQRSDSIADTPNQAGPNAGKPSYPSITCSNGPHGDMFMNYMDYSDDAAMLMFSLGQIERMNATLAGPRASLALSLGLLAPEAEHDQAKPRFGETSQRFANLDSAAQVFNGVDWT